MINRWFTEEFRVWLCCVIWSIFNESWNEIYAYLQALEVINQAIKVLLETAIEFRSSTSLITESGSYRDIKEDHAELFNPKIDVTILILISLWWLFKTKTFASPKQFWTKKECWDLTICLFEIFFGKMIFFELKKWMIPLSLFFTTHIYDKNKGQKSFMVVHFKCFLYHSLGFKVKPYCTY